MLAEPLYLTKYIERMGTGTLDMIRRCKAAGLPEPEFSLSDGFVTIIRRKTGQVIGEVGSKLEFPPEAQEAQVAQGKAQEVLGWEVRLLRVCKDQPATGKELVAAAGYSSRTGNFKRALEKLLTLELLEMTIPGKPRSSSQKYRLTEKGTTVLALTKKAENIL